MTKEEAIKVLNQVRQWTDYPKEAFTMAIDALSRSSLPSELDEAAEKYVSTLCDRADEGLRIDTTLESAFIAGAKWQKEQMMKEAVEGEVFLNPYPTISLDDCKDYDFKDGDKVRIIIIKEEKDGTK